MSAQPQSFMTVQEYFVLEQQSEVKHEYYRGAAYAMTGASARHNLIVGNIFASLHAQLRKKPCQIFPSDLRIQIEQANLFTYPDISVVCGEVQFLPGRDDTIVNPIVLVEVLSPSTENYDRGRKFEHYRTLESFREYLVVAQDHMHVEHYVRQDHHRWLLVEFFALEQVVRLDAIGCTLTIDDIYEKVVFGSEG